MRISHNLPMELMLIVALFAAVIVTIFALQEEPGDRTRFTVECYSGNVQVGQHRAPPQVEETMLGR